MRRLLALSLTFLTICITSIAQSGGGITVEKSAIGPGGVSHGGSFLLEGVFGQPVAGNASAGGLVVSGGFVVPQLAPTSAGVSVSGRVLTPDGLQGVRNAVVVLTDSAGVKQWATTATFGNFSFRSVPAGRSYLISVESRRYLYMDQFVYVTDTLSGLQFVGQDR